MIRLAVLATLTVLNLTMSSLLEDVPVVLRTFILATRRRTDRHVRPDAPAAPAARPPRSSRGRLTTGSVDAGRSVLAPSLRAGNPDPSGRWSWQALSSRPSCTCPGGDVAWSRARG
jgi:hypothetical protein